MKRRDFNRMFGTLAAGPLVAPSLVRAATPGAHSARRTADGPRRWSFSADIAECCSCEIPCPCNFGLVHTPCHGSRLIRITEGEHEGDDLAGSRFVVTFNLGQWTRIYMDESMSDSQVAALERFLPVGFGGFDRGARVRDRVPLSIEETETTFRFSVPESTVEMRMLPGLDGGPIRIDGLPSNVFHDYVQYESVVHEHTGPDLQWSHEGTNGFRSRMVASG